MSFSFSGYIRNIVFFDSRTDFVIIPKRLEISLWCSIVTFAFFHFSLPLVWGLLSPKKRFLSFANLGNYQRCR